MPGGVSQCCKLETMTCTSDCQCCGSLLCQNGVCTPCRSDGASCLSACSADAACAVCCAGYCRVDGRCGPPQGCIEYGQVCTPEDLCCNDVPCIGPQDGGTMRCRYP
jgi:hypothetical protein